MDLYTALKLAHVIGAAILFGTGLGIAFFMLWAHRTGEVAAIAVTARGVVVADFLFTATAIIAQPLTGIALAVETGTDLGTSWIVVSLILYGVAGLCWLPVVWLQIRMRNLANTAAANGSALGEAYQTYFRLWFWLGWPAFLSVVAIFGMMITKPVLW